MTRSQAANSPLRALPAFVAWLVTLLQVLGALHFALVPHTFSAALGGVMHVHEKGQARVSTTRHTAVHPAALSSEAASCGVDACAVASAPAGSVLPSAAARAAWVSVGGVSLLGDSAPQLTVSRHILLSAPKTSPPV